MKPTVMHSITVFVDVSREKELREKLVSLGASNCFVSEARLAPGRLSDPGVHQTTQMRIETIVREDLAESIVSGLHEQYCQDASVIYFASDVLTDPATLKSSASYRGVRPIMTTRWGDYLISI